MANFLSVLPAEIRNRIYHEVVKTTDYITILPEPKKARNTTTNMKIVSHPLSQVCKQTQAEFGPMWSYWGLQKCTITTIITDCVFTHFYDWLKATQITKDKEIGEMAIILRQTKPKYTASDWMQLTFWARNACPAPGLYVAVGKQAYEVRYCKDQRRNDNGAANVALEGMQPFSEHRLIYAHDQNLAFAHVDAVKAALGLSL